MVDLTERAGPGITEGGSSTGKGEEQGAGLGDENGLGLGQP